MSELQPGMRVRSRRNKYAVGLKRGNEYQIVDVAERLGRSLVLVAGNSFWHRMDDFKPIVRIKAIGQHQ
jgi:hypothetical protein